MESGELQLLILHDPTYPSTMLSDSGNLSSLKTPDSITHRSMKLQLPSPEQENLRCPRCDSTNTKFCYYNNYNLSQPRHFCKSCRRYWTKGGALRNIPVGGGNRKNNKRPAPMKPLVQSVESEAAQAAVSGQGDGIHDVTGSFGSLLASSGCFGYFGEPFVNLWSLGLGKQEAPVFSSGEPLGYNGTWGMQEMYGSGGIGNSWQSGNNVVVVSSGGEGFENDCWAASVWPELAISGPGKSLQ